METHDARFASFKKSKRVKNPDKPSSSITLKWPHPSDFKANPQTLADAGFYFNPSHESPDNVKCYMCEKELGGWEEDDDPFLIHLIKCGQSCGWASARCGLVFDVDQDGRFVSLDKTRLPSHKSMEKARLETFSAGKGWIHDKTSDHGASSIKMARAGFVFAPHKSEDDLATCFYCGLSLSGWVPEDDPLEEHRKRQNKSGFTCAFFATSSDAAPANKPPSRTKTTKPSSKSQSKPPSRSTSRSKHQHTVEATKPSDDEFDDDDEPATKPVKLAAKTPRKGRSTSSSSTKKSTAKTPGSKVRSSSRSGLKNVVEEVEDEDDAENSPLEPQPPVTKKVRSRSKSVAKPEVAEDVEVPEEEEPQKPVRSRSKKATSEAEEDPPRKASRTRSKSKASVAPSGEEGAEPLTVKHARTKSRAKAVESEQEELQQITAKPKHKRAVSRSKSKAPVQVLEVESEPEPEPEPEIVTAAPKKASSKPQPPRTPAAQNLFDDDVFVDSVRPAKPSSTVELPPLFVPKRNTTKQPVHVPEDEDPVTPAEKEKRKPGRSKTKPIAASRPKTPEDYSTAPERPDSPGISNSVAHVSANPSVASLRKEKLTGKAKETSQGREAPGKQNLKVVEISSDEEPEENTAQTIPKEDREPSRHSKAQTPLPRPQSPAKPPSSRAKRAESPVEQVQQPTPAQPTSPLAPADNGPDVSMKYEDPNDDVQMEEAPPRTPPRQTVQAPPSDRQLQRPVTPPAEEQPNPSEPLFVPALSKIPFTPLHALTEAELDMTVEEWIRYQMEVEYDKFRRDGERELQRFRKRSEEVRKVIEGL